MNELLSKLRKRFDPRDIRTRKQGGKDLQYIEGSTIVGRLLDTLGWEWDWHTTDYKVTDEPRDGKWYATVCGNLKVYYENELGDTSMALRSGVGAGMNSDLDTALKTAETEALKKAAWKFGVALELWDEGIRNQNERVMKAIGSDDMSDLKTAVFELALIGGADASAQGVADYFGVSVEALQEASVLQEILQRQPV